jgi:hypothetical protein
VVFGPQPLQARFSVRGPVHGIAFVRQVKAQDLGDVRVILHHQDAAFRFPQGFFHLCLRVLFRDE